jgi:hypothetical protein
VTGIGARRGIIEDELVCRVEESRRLGVDNLTGKQQAVEAARVHDEAPPSLAQSELPRVQEESVRGAVPCCQPKIAVDALSNVRAEA